VELKIEKIEKVKKFDFFCTLFICVFFTFTVPGYGAEEGLIVHYSFDEGEGRILNDNSGFGNNGKIIGGAEWINGSFGSALKFDGKDDYVDCGKKDNWNLGEKGTGTVMIWAKPEPAQGGLISFIEPGKGYHKGARLIFKINAYYGGRKNVIVFGDGKNAAQSATGGSVLEDKWTHFAVSFVEDKIEIYIDGVLRHEKKKSIQPDFDGSELWIGRCFAYSPVFFKGMLDEVRVYNNNLTALEIKEYYKKTATNYQRKADLFNKVNLSVIPYPAPGKIVARLDVQGMQPLPENTKIKVNLYKSGLSQKPIQEIEKSDYFKGCASDAIFNVQDLAEGDYVVQAHVIDSKNELIGEISSESITWPGRDPAFEGIKILNNFCWEMIHASPVEKSKYTFTLPCERWVYIETHALNGIDGVVRLGVDSEKPQDSAMTHYYTKPGRNSKHHNVPNPPAREPHKTIKNSMLLLKPGKHTVYIDCRGDAKLEKLIVRAVPAIMHFFAGATSGTSQFDKQDWIFLKKHLPHINTMVSGIEYYSQIGYDYLEDWKKMGRKWLSFVNAPNWMPGTPEFEKNITNYYNALNYRAGAQHPLIDGIFLDEFVWGETEDGDIFTGAMNKLHANPKFKGKKIALSCGPLYGEDAGTELGRVLFQKGDYLLHQRYFHEASTKKQLQKMIQERMTNEMIYWEKAIPGYISNFTFMMGCGSIPPRMNLAINPNVDFKVCLDIQMNTLVNHPSYFGLGGFGWWANYLANEETMRWLGKVTDHYAIQGNTGMLSSSDGFKYRLSHLENSDFTQGTDKWNCEAAAPDSMRIQTFDGFGMHVQGRYGGTVHIDNQGVGNTFLLTKRTAEKPNVFSQEMKNLTPGKLYSLKMYTADYQDLIQGISEKKIHSVSIDIDNVEHFTSPSKMFQIALRHNRALEKFSNKHEYWQNYHYRIFRAKGTTATLTISDWETKGEPQGPLGQELTFNFIEVQPYLED